MGLIGTTFSKRDVFFFFAGVALAAAVGTIAYCGPNRPGNRFPAMRQWYRLQQDLDFERVCFPPGDRTVLGSARAGSYFYSAWKMGDVNYLCFEVQIRQEELDRLAVRSGPPSRSR